MGEDPELHPAVDIEVQNMYFIGVTGVTGEAFRPCNNSSHFITHETRRHLRRRHAVTPSRPSRNQTPKSYAAEEGGVSKLQ